MFDTIYGLPVHPLVVHAVVVLLLLMSIVTVAVALRPVWRRYALPVVVVNAAVLVAAYAAKESGERLQARLQQFNPTVAQDHAQQAGRVPYVALGVLVAAVLVWLTSRSARLVPVAVVVALVAGAAGIGWTYLAGESGARAVWEQPIANTQPPVTH
jgi:uncharacterized membrane protein